jgi:uncharacterized membrane protein
MILFKQYSNQKNKIANDTAAHIETATHSTLNKVNTQKPAAVILNQQREPNQDTNETHYKTNKIETALEMTDTNAVNSVATGKTSDQQISKKNHLSKSEQNMTVMVIVMCVLSFLVHVILLASIIYPMYYFNIIDFILYFLIDFSLPLKAVIDFFLFYFFNKKFKQCTLKMFKL